MKIFKVPKRAMIDNDEHEGYFYTTSKSEAKTFFKGNGADEKVGDKIEEISVAMNKHDLIAFLNIHCSHPDNG